MDYRTKISMPPEELGDRSWKGDEEDPDTALMISRLDHYGVFPDHKIDEAFMARHQLEAGMKLTCDIEGEVEYSSICASSAVDTFDKLKKTIFKCLQEPPDMLPDVACVHIDKFFLQYINKENVTISSEIKQGTKKYRKTGTEYSPQTYNAMMKATTAQISILRSYCVCDDTENCEMAKRCPKIHISLSRLNVFHERTNEKGPRRGRRVHPDKIVIIDFQQFGLGRGRDCENGQLGNTPNLMISQECLQRLIKMAQPPYTPESRIAASHHQKLYHQSAGEEDAFDEPAGNEYQQQSHALTPRGRMETIFEISSSDDDVPMSGVARFRKPRHS